MNALIQTANLGVCPFKVIEQAALQPSTKQQYSRQLTKYLEAGHRLTDTQALIDYSQGLKNSPRAFLKAALKLWAGRVEMIMKGQATPENVAAIQASIYRLESLNEAIETESPKGQKAHTWLTQAEVKKLLATCDDSLQGFRDRLTLGLLVGAGLRREELAKLKFEHILEQPAKGNVRTVLQIHGKGAKDRVVPIKSTLARDLAKWAFEVGGREGFIIRSMNNGAMGDSISSVGIFNIVRAHGEAIGKPDLAPHDLRRTYAQLGYEAGVPLTQISKLLGHSSVATTQKYLNLDLDLETTISDFIPYS